MNAAPTNLEFDASVLSEDGRRAYQSLITASQFEDAHIGYAGVLSRYAKNLEILLNEEKADEAFKSMLKSGTTAGKLYTLCGLFYTDHRLFKKEIDKFRSSKDRVSVASGCEIYGDSVSNLIESNAPNVAIIGPGETLEQYLAGNNGRSYNIDIANGGYPATFRHFAKQELENKK